MPCISINESFPLPLGENQTDGIYFLSIKVLYQIFITNNRFVFKQCWSKKQVLGSSILQAQQWDIKYSSSCKVTLQTHIT